MIEKFEIHAAHPQATHWDHTRRVGEPSPLIESAEPDSVTFERCSAELVTLVVRYHGRIPTRWGVCGCGILWGPFNVPREIRAEIREVLSNLKEKK